MEQLPKHDILSQIKILKQDEISVREGENNSDFMTNGEFNFISKIINGSSFVFDVGANIGEWSATVCQQKPGVSVVAFEPVPDLFRILSNNVQGLPVKLENIAVSSSEGEENFFYYSENSNRFSGMSTFYRRNGVEKDLKLKPQQVLVKKTTLDNYCSSNKVDRINFVKIDTEGSEKDVLAGTEKLLKNHCIDALQFEYGGTFTDAGITLKEIVKYLSNKGYLVFKIIPSGLIHISEWTDELENFNYANYCAISSLLAPQLKTTHFYEEQRVQKNESKMEELKLHLGCGQKYLPGYINIDYPPTEHSVQQNAKVDLYADITSLVYPEDSVDEIRLHHVFEHFDRPAALALLCKWHQWLKPCGRLVIETPDLEESLSLLQSTSLNYKGKQAVLRHVFGSHEASWAVHYDGWYKEKFEHTLTRLNYKIISIEKSEWQLTRNITVIAEKIPGPLANLHKAVHDILADSKIDDSASENILHKTWINNFEKALKKVSSVNPVQKDETPGVSIFMPVYNGEKYIAQTLDSLLSQTFTRYEILIIDDGSEDKTLEIAKEYAKKDKRIKVFSLEHEGEVNARNFALTKVNPGSKYLMNHDSDDISAPMKLEKLVEYLERNPETDIAGCSAIYFDDESNSKGAPPIEYEYSKIKESFGKFNSMINSAALIRKKVFEQIGGYREEFKSVDDYDFFSRALIAGFKLANLTEILHAIRLHPNSIGSKRAETQKKLARIISEKYEEFLAKEKIRNCKAPAIASKVLSDNHLDILHTVEFYHPHTGGAELVIQQLSERLVKRGHRVTVATTKLPGRYFNELNGVSIEEFDLRGSIGTGIKGEDFLKYQDFISSHSADVMMNYAAQQWGTDVVFTVLDKIVNKRVNIIAPCGYSALQDSRTLRWPQFANYFNEFIPKIIPVYDAAVYHSSKYQDYQYAVEHQFKNSVVIPNGVCEEEFENVCTVDFREKYNIRSKFLGLCVANYFKNKGHERIVEAIIKLKRDDFTLVCIGKEGDELNNLKSISAGLNIVFLDNISREDTIAAYHKADLFLFGSLIEAFPLVILEAMASKTPFISTNCGNVKELKGGVVCEKEELTTNINKLLDNESLRKKLAAEGYKEWKENYTWEAVTNKYEDLYLRLYHKKFKEGSKSRMNVIQAEIEHDYTDINSYLSAAKLLLTRNKPAEAVKYLEDALELDYQNSQAEQLLNLTLSRL